MMDLLDHKVRLSKSSAAAQAADNCRELETTFFFRRIKSLAHGKLTIR